MVYETDNAESRIGQTGDSLTNGDHLVSEAYAGMPALAKQQRETQRAGGGASSSDYLVLTDPYRDLQVGPPPRTGREQPVPAPQYQWDHEQARSAGQRGDEIAQERLEQASRRRSGGHHSRHRQ